MIVSITALAKANGRPSTIGANTLNNNYSTAITFTVANFTSETTPAYVDPEGDAANYIKILSLPDQGSLTLDGGAVSINDIITVGQISAGNFVYTPDDLNTDAVTTSFQFDVADSGSLSLSGLNDGIITIQTAAQPNLPPDNVGDNAINALYGTSIIFTKANFTTETTPPYSDPEGDEPFMLKVTSLPADGTLQLDGVPVGVNQEIPFTEIDAGYLVFVPNVLTITSNILTFDFEISDEGSQLFTG